MSFRDFTLRLALETFGLIENSRNDLFAAVPPREPGANLVATLDQLAPVALGFGSEAARSAFIIAPTLAEVMRQAGGGVTVLPGATLDVDRDRGLSGFCDFLVTRSDKVHYIHGPVAAVIEAKKEDIVGGLGQCAAAMVAVRLLNEADKTPLPAVYGCVSSGNVWQFLKLEGSTLFIDRTEYYLRDLPKLLGILVHIALHG